MVSHSQQCKDLKRIYCEFTPKTTNYANRADLISIKSIREN